MKMLLLDGTRYNERVSLADPLRAEVDEWLTRIEPWYEPCYVRRGAKLDIRTVRWVGERTDLELFLAGRDGRAKVVGGELCLRWVEPRPGGFPPAGLMKHAEWSSP